MHPVLRKFSKRRPRAYGLILLALGAVLAKSSSIPVLIVVGIIIGFWGIAFLVLGSKFNPDEPSSEEIKPRAHPGAYCFHEGQPMTIDELQCIACRKKHKRECLGH